MEAPTPSLQDLLRGAGVSSLLGSVLWKVNALALFKPVVPINSICQLNRGPGALSGALSGASHPSKCLVREMASVESCVPNLFMPRVRCREGARYIKQISFADVTHWSHITAFKTDESVGLSLAKQNGERNYYRCALYSIQSSLKSISFAEMVTLSQLAGIGYRRAIDWTQCAILRDQSYDPSTVLEHTMFTEEPRPVKHYNTMKYESIKRKCLFSVQQITKQCRVGNKSLDSPIPWLHDASSLPIRVLPSCKIKKSWHNVWAAVGQAEQLTGAKWFDLEK